MCIRDRYLSKKCILNKDFKWIIIMKVLKFFLDMQHSDSAVDPSIIGGSVGGCLAFIVGVAVAVFVVWYLDLKPLPLNIHVQSCHNK